MDKAALLSYWTHFVAVSLFALGLLGFLVRKNTLVVLMSLELMLNAANLLLVQSSVKLGTPDGMIMVVFVITVAAAEVGVGLGIVLNLFRLKNSVDMDSFRNMQG